MGSVGLERHGQDLWGHGRATWCRHPTPAGRRLTDPCNTVKTHYRKRRQTVEPTFGIIKFAMGFRRFHLRSLAKVATEWTLVALAYNCRRMVSLQSAPAT